MRRWAAFTALIVLAAAPRDHAQTPAPTFDVIASVRPDDSGQTHAIYSSAFGTTFRTTNASLRFLIALAYDIKDFQIYNAPESIASERYDIQAKADAGAADPATLPILRRILEDRFKLAVRRETREVPIYELVVTKDGPKLETAKAECRAANAPGPACCLYPCGRVVQQPTHMAGKKIQISSLANALSSRVDRGVIDRTGILGDYDIALEWVPDENLPAGSPDDTTASISAELRKLGLALRSARGRGDVLVIDHVEKPSPN